MRTLRFFGAPKLRQPTFSNLAPKKPSQIPLIQKPKKTLQNLNPQQSKPKVIPTVTLKTPKPSTSNKNLKIDTKDNLILPTTYALPSSNQPHLNTSPIKLKKTFNPIIDNNDKHYNPQQPCLKKVTKPISIQTFPVSKVKSLHSYTNTASSTVNSEQNNTAAFHTNNNNNNNIHKEGATGDYSSFKKVDIFKNNIFLNKILLCINSLVNPKYSEKDLCKNPELLQKLIALESKNNLIEEKMKLQQLNKDVNIINADMIQSSNQIAFESEQRKEIYQNYFNFYFDICKDIEMLAQQLEKQNCANSYNNMINNMNSVRNNYDNNNDNNNNNKHINELKKIDEVNSKLSSLHSVINFSKTESQVLPCNINNNHLYNNNNVINTNTFRNPTTIPISPGSIHSTFNFNINNSSKSNNTQTLLISSLGSEFYQKIAEESFKNEINNFFSIYEEEDHNNDNDHDNDNNNDNNISIDSSATVKGEFHPSTTKTKINILNGHNRSKTDIGVVNNNNNNNNNNIKRTNYSCNSSNSSDIIYNDDSDSTIIDKDESNDTYYRIPTQIPVINPGIHLSITPLKKENNVKAATQTTPSPPKLISPNQKDNDNNNNCMIF